MYPTTPISMEMMLNATHSEHRILGMNMNEVIIIISAP